MMRGLIAALVIGAWFVPSTWADDKPSELVQLVIGLLGDKDKDLRAVGLEQVRNEAKGAEATKLFAVQLPKLDPVAQVGLLSALADRGDVAARPAVLDLLATSRDESVRAAALASLGKLGSVADVSLLMKSLTADSDVQRSAAQRSLVQLRGETVSKSLAKEAVAAAPPVKAAILEVLAARRASDELPTFLASSVDDNARVRSAAMTALGQLGRPDQLAVLLPGVLKAEKGPERDAAERNVAIVCSRIEDEDQRGAAVIQALSTLGPAQRDELLSLAGRVGGKKLIGFVAEIATSGDPVRRKLGIDALSKWPDGSVADKLLEIANQSTDAAERSQAFSGYVRTSATRDQRSDAQRLERMKQAMTAARTNEERLLVINRSRTAYAVETMRFVLPYVDQPAFAQMACETIVELAHHREVRDPHKTEFDKALDKVIAVSKDPVVIDRAGRYKRGETWVRPAKPAGT